MEITTNEKKTYQPPCIYVENVEPSPLCGLSSVTGEGNDLDLGGGSGGPFRSNPFSRPGGGLGGPFFGGPFLGNPF